MKNIKPYKCPNPRRQPVPSKMYATPIDDLDQYVNARIRIRVIDERFIGLFRLKT